MGGRKKVKSGIPAWNGSANSSEGRLVVALLMHLRGDCRECNTQQVQLPDASPANRRNMRHSATSPNRSRVAVRKTAGAVQGKIS
jgi:hypothetical protein